MDEPHISTAQAYREKDAIAGELARAERELAGYKHMLSMAHEQRDINRDRAEQSERKCAELSEALGLMYDKWENGDDCWDDPNDGVGYLGKAFRLSDEEEGRILALLPPTAALASQPGCPGQLRRPHGEQEQWKLRP
jgi:hypothetical protein